MAYISRADMVARFGAEEISQLLDRDNDSADDADAFASTAADASGIIDGYLAAVTTLPLATVPTIVMQLAADISRYLLWDDRAPEEIRRRYDDALKRLQDISRGAMVLCLPAKPTATASLPMSTTRVRTFDDDTLAPFVGR